MKILTQVYTGAVRPHMEYAATAWSSAAKTNIENLAKVQNTAMRLITGGIKTTPIPAMEKLTGLLPLQERREEKLLRQSEKMKRLPSHPLHEKLQAPTKNRLKRQSPNHLIKALQQKHSSSLPPRDHDPEPLQDFEDWSLDVPHIILDVPGIGAKEEHTGAELKSLTLEMLHTRYPNTTWTHVYTDGSAENAVRNGGGGVFIRLPDGTHVSKSVATGHYSTNFRAEATALLTAAKTLNQMENLPDHTAILTDCRALLQSLQTRERERAHSTDHQTGIAVPQLQDHSYPAVDSLSLRHSRQRGSRPTLQGRQQAPSICPPNVLWRNENHPSQPAENHMEAAPAVKSRNR
nr:hypothetical protein BaRGS_030968 [Batillaria attramentaria]